MSAPLLSLRGVHTHIGAYHILHGVDFEVPVVLDLIRMLKARKDRLILLVEHKMDVVRELSDRIVVLHNGQLVADGEPATVIASPVVQQAYLGMAAEEPA